jgi:hypothetical protein
MQSDTVIGIVGAVVLVAVMVGVFAYEYNNAPEGVGTEPDSPEAQMASFNDTYGSLNGMGDIDGDGTPNYLDADMDGDGIDNANDTMVQYVRDFMGNVPARTLNQVGTPADTSTSFILDIGHKGGVVEVTWTTTGQAGQAVDDLQVSIPGGDVVCDNSATGSATCDLSAAPAGAYTVRVVHSGNAPAQGKSFTGTLTANY